MTLNEYEKSGGDMYAIADTIQSLFDQNRDNVYENELRIQCADREDLDNLLSLIEVSGMPYKLGFMRRNYPSSQYTNWDTLYLSNGEIHIGKYGSVLNSENEIFLSAILENALFHETVDYSVPDIMELWGGSGG